ncbi:MAG: hydroxymethylbilane synthase [Pseudomonadota bacterium]
MAGKKIRLGTRGSDLALAQAHEVRDRLMAEAGIAFDAVEIKVISTAGDQIQDKPLSEVGGKGLFSKEIENALLANEVDIAVHSAKDMATRLPDGLEMPVFLPREDVRDCLISNSVANIDDLPPGAVVGSASLRRQALIARLRPDLNCVLFRGNVQTRLRKLQDGQADATLLAHAGLKRLGLQDKAASVLDTDLFPPAPAQGAIGLELRADDHEVRSLITPINDHETERAVACERAFLAALDGSCRLPIAGYAKVSGADLSFHGLIASPDGQSVFETRIAGLATNAESIGSNCGAKLRAQAGEIFFEGWSGAPGS